MNLEMRRSVCRKSVTAVLAAVIFFLAAAPRLAAQAAAAPAPAAEHGKFRLHKFEQPIGEEKYQITPGADGALTVKMDFEFTDRGQKVPLKATFTGAADLTPQSFEIKGQTSRSSAIDAAVEVQAAKVRIRNDKDWTEAARPERFFTISGYAPATMQMLLVRYWAQHGSPTKLATLPHGTVQIEPRGHDELTVNGQSVVLDRYTVEGLIWGRETLWFDSTNKLVAAVTTDAEFDHFEAIREGYEPELGTFVSKAAQDGMAALAELSRTMSGSRSDALALVGGTLVDGTGQPALRDATVLIGGGRIVAAGPRLKVQVPKGTKVIDARGKTILPGLWDMHAHFEQVEWGPIYLAAGVTTARDVGNETEFITASRDAIAAGRGLGPRLLLAGIVDGDGPLALGINRVNSPAEAVAAVDRYNTLGFLQMKIYSSVKRENVAAVAAEAHKLGMTVTGHIPEGMTAYEGVDAGMDQINHINYIADIMHKPFPSGMPRMQRMEAMGQMDLHSSDAQHALEFLKAHGTVVDPTLALMEMFGASSDRPLASFEPGVEKVAPELKDALTSGGVPLQFAPLARAVFNKEVEIVGALHRAGIPVVAGTDQSVPGHSLHREIELYVQAGFTPMEAIQAATLVPARVMRLDKELGTVERGKRADVIVLDANPLDNISNIRKVKYVITGGVVYDCAPLWQSVGFQP